MKSLKLFFLFLSFALLFTEVKAQPSVLVKCIVDPFSITANSFEWDVYIRRTSVTPLNYVKGQYVFTYNTNIRPGGNGGTWTLTLLNSELPPPKRCAILGTSTSTNGQFILWGQADDVSDFFIPDTSDVLVTRAKATLSVPLVPDTLLKFAWRRSGTGAIVKMWYYDGVNSVGIPAGNITDSMYNANIPVPVELSSFTASAQGRDVNLSWETKTEVNSSRFEIERTSEGIQNWAKVGQVAASGNSNSPKQYGYTDKKLNSGKYSYRLKMVDADGSYKYSSLVETEIALPKEYALSQNYPNPFNPTTRVDYQLPFDSKVTLDLYGITGEKVATILNAEQSAGYYTADINAGQLNIASGVYIYRMTANSQSGQNFVQVKKLMLTK